MMPSAPETTIRAGRPTREQAAARHDAMLARALDLFMEKGFEQTTVEAIAADVSMTKRTIYARYPDKAALFLAAARRGIADYAVGDDRIVATRSADLATTLSNIAMLRIGLLATPRGVGLWRMVNHEAFRFPVIFDDYYRIAALPTVRFLAQVLAEETERGALAIDDPMMAANTFMTMVVGGPVQFIAAGHPLSEPEIEARVAFAIALFLDGARPRHRAHDNEGKP